MSLRIYNTLTKREEDFVPIDKKNVTMYTCGPTVYGRPHIGNYSSFLMADLLRRWLTVSGYTVTHVKNITDVGHLIADADTGEDKIEKQAKQENAAVTAESVLSIARKYEQQYLEDEKTLNFIAPEHRPRATEYIDQMKRMIEQLLNDGIAYVTDDGIYFDVTKFPAYGNLSGNRIEDVDSGARVKINQQKKHPADFALWKFCVGENANHVLRWESPQSKSQKKPTSPTPPMPMGFPGWHIECSAMSRALLGDQIDIHTGGEDNIFPHHECEIAQSESCTNKKPFVKYWLHRRRIDIGEQKMSKSLGNALSVPDILQKGYSAGDIRYFLLSVHYRTNLKFTEKGLDDAHKARRKIAEWIVSIENGELEMKNEKLKMKHSFIDDFTNAMNADLNTPQALAVIFDAMNASRNGSIDGASLDQFISMINNTFGCFEPDAESLPSAVQKLVDERKIARDQKNFAQSDRLRDEIKARGYEVRDDGKNQTIKKI